MLHQKIKWVILVNDDWEMKNYTQHPSDRSQSVLVKVLKPEIPGNPPLKSKVLLKTLNKNKNINSNTNLWLKWTILIGKDVENMIRIHQSEHTCFNLAFLAALDIKIWFESFKAGTIKKKTNKCMIRLNVSDKIDFNFEETNLDTYFYFRIKNTYCIICGNEWLYALSSDKQFVYAYVYL